MSKSHETCGIVCKHANMSYCEHCKVPYCKDCKTEWRNYFNSGAISVSGLPYYDKFTATGPYQIYGGTLTVDPSLPIPAKCDH